MILQFAVPLQLGLDGARVLLLVKVVSRHASVVSSGLIKELISVKLQLLTAMDRYAQKYAHAHVHMVFQPACILFQT